MINNLGKLILLYSIIFISSFSWAEYRVFKLQITNSKTKQIKQFQSTLDPIQYTNLYPLAQFESITYVQTWRCKGRTDLFKPHCEPPANSKTEPTKA